MNSSTSYLMFILCKSSTNKYMIMVKNIIDKIMKNMIKLIKKKKLFITQILNWFFLPVFFSLKSHLFTIIFFFLGVFLLVVLKSLLGEILVPKTVLSLKGNGNETKAISWMWILFDVWNNFWKRNKTFHKSRGDNSCSRVGFVSCQVMSIRLHRSIITRHVY